jgi:SAM-dependent methyltransferase
MKWRVWKDDRKAIERHILPYLASMQAFDRKAHWENIYATKQLNEVSWYQLDPRTSLDFLTYLDVPKKARILDVGGGDSYFVDKLLALGYSHITVLDISRSAVERAQKRLGHLAEQVEWVVSDVLDFKPDGHYDFWHDRAAFHFLTEASEVEAYVQLAESSLSEEGALMVGTFSENGPLKCSGIQIKQYSEQDLTQRMQRGFSKVKCLQIDHSTPFDTVQHFTFCGFRKRH